MTEIQVRGSEALLARLEELARRIDNPSGAATALQDVFSGRLRRRMEAEGEGDWPDLRASGLRLKAQRDPRRMRDTGALEAAITGGQVQTESGGVRYTAEVPFYGAFLATRATLPPFPIVREDDQELVGEITDALRRFLEETPQ